MIRLKTLLNFRSLHTCQIETFCGNVKTVILLIDLFTEFLWTKYLRVQFVIIIEKYQVLIHLKCENQNLLTSGVLIIFFLCQIFMIRQHPMHYGFVLRVMASIQQEYVTEKSMMTLVRIAQIKESSQAIIH